jgi:hypothetical protein
MFLPLRLHHHLLLEKHQASLKLPSEMIYIQSKLWLGSQFHPLNLQEKALKPEKIFVIVFIILFIDQSVSMKFG